MRAIMLMSSTKRKVTMTTNTTKEVRANAKAAKEAANPGRKGRVIATIEGILIGAVIMIALGFVLGDHYASNRNAQVNTAVKSAVTALKVKQ